MADYAKRLHRPQVIDDVIRTADPALVLAGVIEGIPAPRKPPQIRLSMLGPAGQALGTQLTVQDPALTLRIEAEAAQGGQVRSIAVYNGPMSYPPDVLPPAAERTRSITKEIRLWRRDNPLIIEALDELGVKGKAELFVRLERPPVDPNKPRLVIKSIGVGTFAADDPPAIPFAARDVNEIAAFLAKPGGDPRFESERIDRTGIVDTGGGNPPADTPHIRKIVDELIGEAKQERLGRGDTVFLVINSHVLSLDKEGSMVLGSDARRDRPAPAGIRTGEVTEALKYLTDRGCFVTLFLDGIHTRLRPRDLKDFRTWVRDLTDQARVVVCVASKQDPSDQLDSEAIGVFARAILESVNVKSGALNPNPSIEEFKSIVINRVDERKRKGSYQKADLYSPLNMNERLTPIFDPQPRPVENLARK